MQTTASSCSTPKYPSSAISPLPLAKHIKIAKDYINVVTTTKNIIAKQSIASLEEILPANNFIRIHRSFIVAINKIESFTSDTIDIGKHQLPISRMYRHEVNRVLQLE